MGVRLIRSVLALLVGLSLASHAAILSSTLGPNEAIHLRVAGSSLLDSNGLESGNVEALVVHPQSAEAQFALVSLSYPSNRNDVTPVPWQLVQHHRDARAAGGIPGTFQQLVAPVGREALLRAPRISLEGTARTNDATWMSTSLTYFAALGAVGGIGSAPGTQTGGNAASTDATGYSTGAAAYDNGYWWSWPAAGGGGFSTNLADFLALGSNIFGTNFLTNIIGTNVLSTNAMGTNAGFNTNFLQALTNFFATNFFSFTNRTGTNKFTLTPFGSNFFRTNFFGTNGIPGSRTNALTRPTNAPPLGGLPSRFTNAPGIPRATNVPPPLQPGLPPGTAPLPPAVPPPNNVPPAIPGTPGTAPFTPVPPVAPARPPGQ